MNILCLTDLHSRADVLEDILRAAQSAVKLDAILLGGDITQFGTPNETEALVWIARMAGPPVWAVAGNCDSATIDQRLAELDVSLHGRGVMLGDVGLHGLSGMPPWRGDMYQFTEAELATALQAGRAQIAGSKRHLVLSHAPPWDVKVDRTFLGKHVGSHALREFIEIARPDLVFCGHIHEGRGIDRIGQTTVVNCGAAKDGFYALAEVGEGVNVELKEL
jgi:uncharacterized protein